MANEKLQLTPDEEVEVISATGDRIEVAVTYAPGGERPPAHVHPHQDERFEVLEGTVTVELRGESREYSAGEAFEVPRGAPHRMANAGTVPARLSWTTTPGGRTLEWFRALEATQRRVEGRRLARLLAFGPLLLRFRDTFRLARG